jgi:hypothetical protein
MTKIGVISDTHLMELSLALEKRLRLLFADCPLIIHCGDLVHLNVLDSFHDREVLAVAGNMDGADVRRSFPLKRKTRIEDVNLGIIHGWGAPEGIRSRIRREFEGVELICYGHSHQPFAATETGIFFMNPGSPSRPRFTAAGTVGIIEVHGKEIRGDILAL